MRIVIFLVGISGLDAFQEADADGSGDVSFAEFEATFHRQHEGNRQGNIIAQ